MADESLSQNQVENLLKAMETVGDGPPQPQPTGSTGESGPVVGSVPQSSVGPGARITAYDFKRPERVGKDQMRAMHSLHEALARNFGAAISGMLRTMIEVKLLSVDHGNTALNSISRSNASRATRTGSRSYHQTRL